MRVKQILLGLSLFVTPLVNAQNYQLVWSDEFEGTELNRGVWNYEIGTGDWGWGNNELQYYTDREANVKVSDGKLTITCKKEEYNGSHYTSGRIQTRNKVAFKYGKIESLIKVPKGATGVWPAFWMLGTGHGGSWPNCGEIDIMEMMCKQGNANDSWNTALTTYHWCTDGIDGDYSKHGSHGLGYTYSEELGAKWRIYGLEWTPTLMTGYVCDADGSNRHDICSLDISSRENGMEAFADYEFYIVYNFAFGGTYVNNNIDPSWTGDNMQVEWVKVYQDTDNYPHSTNSIGDFTPKVNTDYVKVLSDRDFEGSVLDLSAAPFYIWEGTMKAHDADTFEGENAIGLENCGSTWYGAGYNYGASTINYDNLRNYTLHFALKTNNTEPFQLNCNKGNVIITPTKANEWVEYNLPVATTFPTILLGEQSKFETFTFNQVGGTTMSGRTFFIDDIYFYPSTTNTEPNIVVSGQIGKLKDTNAKAKIRVSGSNLSSDVVISSSNPDDFTLSTKKTTPVNGVVNEEIEIEFIGKSSSATKVTFTCGALKTFTTIVSTIRNVERLTTDYIILSKDEAVDGSFRDWSGENIDIWENEWTNGPTMAAAEVTPFEGDHCMAFRALDKGWYGGGFSVNQKLDYEYINRYTLHFAYYASNTNPTQINVFGAKIQIVPEKANTWQVFEFPLWKYNLNFDVQQSVDAFTFNQGEGEAAAVQPGKIIAFDDVYFYMPGGSGVAAISCSSSALIDTRYTHETSFRVSGSNLANGAKVQLYCSNPKFKLSTTNITAVNGKFGHDIVVTYDDSNIDYATIIVKCGDLMKEIKVSSFAEQRTTTCNMFSAFVPDGIYYAHTWDFIQISGASSSAEGISAEMNMPLATTTTWQSQFWFRPTTQLSLTEGEKYSVKATLISNKDVTVTFKLVEHGVDANLFVEQKVKARAGVPAVIDYTGVAGANLNNMSILFDFGGNPANTKVNVYSVEVGEADCYGGDIVFDDATPITETWESDVLVWVRDRVIFVENADSDIQVYDILGHCIYSGCEQQISLGKSGIYIVKIDGQTKKLLVR